MSFNVFIAWLVGIQFSALAIAFFSTYNPLKKKQSSANKRTTPERIKRYFVENTLDQILSILIFMFSIWVFTIISLVASYFSSNLSTLLNLFAIIGTAFFVILSSFLFVFYIRFIRRIENLADSSNVSKILESLKVKPEHRTTLKKMIDLSLTGNSPQKLGSWFLDALSNLDKRIVN